MREKLIELLQDLLDYELGGDYSHLAKDWADHLIAHGVTIQDREIDFDYEAEVE
jgi:hypothetical protein